MGESKANIKAKEDVFQALENGENNAVQTSAVKPEDEEINITEATVENEQSGREELVCQEDILRVVDMDKGQLQKYAHSRLGKELDLSKRLKMLRLEVVILIKNKLKLPLDTENTTTKKAVAEIVNPEFVFNPANRRIFEWTELFAKRTDLIACYVVDEEGKRL